jgi:hypothetical protein
MRLGNQNIKYSFLSLIQRVYASKYAINKPYLKLQYKEKDELNYMTHQLRKKVMKSFPEKFGSDDRSISRSPSKNRSKSRDPKPSTGNSGGNGDYFEEEEEDMVF